MDKVLSASVGLGGANRHGDVSTVQSLLVSHGFRLGRTDGLFGPRTLAAIRAFQQGFMRVPDGRVDVNGLTWRKLSGSPVAGTISGAGSPFVRTVPKPQPGAVNGGLTAVSNDYMEAALGKPRDSYSADCQPLTNARLKRNVSIASVGRLHVQGLTPALASLAQVLADIAREQPDVYKMLGTAGMLCCRYQRGSSSKISNHSWGTAIDLTIAGILDVRGDGKVQYGLTLIAPIFNRHGWYWGAAFPVEDGMHFEASKSLVERWSSSLP